jgi:hypothetical protein
MNYKILKWEEFDEQLDIISLKNIGDHSGWLARAVYKEEKDELGNTSSSRFEDVQQ